MKKLLSLLVLLLSASLAQAEELLISLYEYDPWHMVMGSDSPTFTLYSDGQAIFWNTELNKYQNVVLNSNDFKSELSKVKTLTTLKGQYTLSDWTDQPTQVLMFKAGDTTHKIGVYGNLRKQKEVREKAPSELLTLFDYYTGYNNSNATDWEPTHIEVMIWPYDYAPEKSIIWPSDWPDINSSSTRKRGDSYSIYLPFEHYDKLKRFIATRNEKGAVEINGEKWAISTRTPFPHEIAMN